MAKAPADQFYYADWLRDVELQMACSTTRGIWMNVLANMWFAEAKGELIGTEEKLARLLNSTDEDFIKFLQEAETLHFCYVSRNSNGCVTLRNRRMYREEKKRISNKLRQQRHRVSRENNAGKTPDVTPPSSSSSPSSSSLSTKKHEPYRLLSKEEITESSVPKLKTDIGKLCEELYQQKIFPKVHAFANQMLKKTKNPRAIIHALSRCMIHKPKKPWAYCLQIMKVENGNYNERNHQKNT